MLDQEDLIKKIKNYNRFFNPETLSKAYNFALNAHKYQKRDANNAALEFSRAFQKFTQAVNVLAKGTSKISGNASDQKIIMNAFKKQVIPFIKLIDSWNQGQQKNPHLKESVNEARNKTITAIGSIIGKKQAKKIDGVLVDMQTANVIMKVWNALNPSNRKKFEKLSVQKMANVAWKLVK